MKIVGPSKFKRRLKKSAPYKALNRFLDYLSTILLSRKRLDHNLMYMCMMFWDLFTGIFAIFIGLPDMAMTHMSSYSIDIITWLMFLGGATCCYGIIIGTKFDPGYWIRPIIGKTNKIDLRIPCIIGMCGTQMLMISFYYYGIAIFTNLDIAVNKTNASEASLSFMFALGCTLNFLRFGLEIRSINSKLPWLIAKEIDMQMSKLVSDDKLE